MRASLVVGVWACHCHQLEDGLAAWHEKDKHHSHCFNMQDQSVQHTAGMAWQTVQQRALGVAEKHFHVPTCYAGEPEQVRQRPAASAVSCDKHSVLQKGHNDSHWLTAATCSCLRLKDLPAWRRHAPQTGMMLMWGPASPALNCCAGSVDVSVSSTASLCTVLQVHNNQF